MHLRYSIIAILLLAGAAQGADLRFPQSGLPAITLNVPNDWASNIDQDGNLDLSSGDHASGFSLNIIEDNEAPTEALTAALATAKAEAMGSPEPVSISGFNGSSLRATMAGPGGIKLDVRFVFVKLDSMHLLSCTMIMADGASAAQIAAANAVFNGIAITGS